MLVTGAEVPCYQASPGGEEREEMGVGQTNYKGKPQLQAGEDRDWGGTGGKDGNATV